MLQEGGHGTLQAVVEAFGKDGAELAGEGRRIAGVGELDLHFVVVEWVAVELAAVGGEANGDAHALELDLSGTFALGFLDVDAGECPIGGFDVADWLALLVKGQVVFRTEAAEEEAFADEIGGGVEGGVVAFDRG